MSVPFFFWDFSTGGSRPCLCFFFFFFCGTSEYFPHIQGSFFWFFQRFFRVEIFFLLASSSFYIFYIFPLFKNFLIIWRISQTSSNFLQQTFSLIRLIFFLPFSTEGLKNFCWASFKILILLFNRRKKKLKWFECEVLPRRSHAIISFLSLVKSFQNFY